MTEPRKIVVILGNGFDLDLGLKTSYKDFWESEFCPRNYPAPLIHHLNQCWPDRLDSVRWYDLENELLEYYNKSKILGAITRDDVITKDEKEFLKVVRPALWEFGNYNKYQQEAQSLCDKGYISFTTGIDKKMLIPYQDDMLESSIWRDSRALNLIKEGLCQYLKRLGGIKDQVFSPSSVLIKLLLESVRKGDTVNIYSFNYTSLIQWLFSNSVVSVHYMHGCCDDGNIIIGTRDDISMEKSYDFLQKVMDDSFAPPDLVSALNDSNEVIVFGHSLGENDRQYFAPFFLRQSDCNSTNKKSITIFTRDDNSKKDIKRALQKMTNGNLSVLYSINQPVIIRTSDIEKDQQLFYDFLLNHHVEEQYAEAVINELLKQKKY